MSNNVMDQITRIIEWISGLGFALPFIIFLIVQLFSRGRKESGQAERPETPPPTERAPTVPKHDPPTSEPIPGMPFGLPAWMGLDEPSPTPAPQPATPVPDSQWGHNFDRQEPTSNWRRDEDWGHSYDQLSDEEDEVLRWGSAFESDAEGEPIRWTSTFDQPGQRNVYGWEGTRWGGTFPPRDSEPVIHVS